MLATFVSLVCYSAIAATSIAANATKPITWIATKNAPQSKETYYDVEMILAGRADGWNTTDIQSNVELQLQFYNGHNFQEIYNAYNFG